MVIFSLLTEFLSDYDNNPRYQILKILKTIGNFTN